MEPVMIPLAQISLLFFLPSIIAFGEYLDGKLKSKNLFSSAKLFIYTVALISHPIGSVLLLIFNNQIVFKAGLISLIMYSVGLLVFILEFKGSK